MESRKIIKFGNSSFVVSLPREWMDKNKLKKGDSVYFLQDIDDSLRVTSQYKEPSKEEKEVVIQLKNRDIDSIFRDIFAAYINNYSVIKLIDNSSSESRKIASIRKKLNSMIGLEVLEQTSNSLIIHDLLDFKNISIKSLLNKEDIICRSMLADSIESIQKDSFESIYQRDVDINRLAHLVHKIVNTCLDDPNSLRRAGVNYRELLDLWSISDKIEKIADESKRIARLFGDLNLNGKQKKELISLYKEIEQDYLSIMKAYYKKDKKLSSEIDFNRKNILDKCDAFFEKNHAPLVGKIIEKMKAAEIHIRDISRAVVNDDSQK